MSTKARNPPTSSSVDTQRTDNASSPMVSPGQQASEHPPASSPTKASKKEMAATSAAALVRDGLNPKLSAVEATSQLKVLCRKFAALTEKVKEETKIREDAEKEVRRLRAIVESNQTPVIASCRAETQAFIKELQDSQEALKHELRVEKDKNAKLVSKALELEKEKSQLMTDLAKANEQARQREAIPPPEPHPIYSRPLRTTTTDWDREQTNKIHETLRITIDELQQELCHRDQELVSNKERLQRERARVKSLEHELQERDDAARYEQNVLQELESSIQEQRLQFEAIEKEMHAADARLEEEIEMRRTLEQQIETLNEVNAALDQRAKTLVRRLELSQGIVEELDELKAQLRDTEVDKETLVRSIKDAKAQHYLQEVQWRGQLEQLRSEKLALASQISELQSEIQALRTQNAMFSEWMLVRSENVAAAKRQPPPAWGISDNTEKDVHKMSGYMEPSGGPATQVHPLPTMQELEANIYAHTSTRCPLSPSKTRSMTTASPIKQPVAAYTRRPSVSSCTSSNSDLSDDRTTPSTTARSFKPTITVKSTPLRSSKPSRKLSDHERLRELMSRNRELQHRLQLETVATRNLEQEISHITASQGKE